MKRYSYEVREDILSYKESIIPKTRKECFCEDTKKVLTEIAQWNEQDDKDPAMCRMHWRGCVALANELLKKMGEKPVEPKKCACNRENCICTSSHKKEKG